MMKISTLPALGVALCLGFPAISVVIAQDPARAKQVPNTKQDPDANALGYDDTPMLPNLPYRVHDSKRPHPKVVTVGHPGEPPSDAIVLFDGKNLSKWTAARRSSDNSVNPITEPAPWTVGDGYFEAPLGKGDIATKEAFGDIQLHLEWCPPADARGNSQNRGNSGVKFQGRYELQVLDSYHNPTYADGQAGSIYGEWPPLVNAVHNPGEWNYYDAVFEAPKFDGDKLVKPAYLTVFLNGVLLHNRKEILGITAHRQYPKYVPQPAEEPLVLQNHNGRERFRNVWVRRLRGYDQPEE